MDVVFFPDAAAFRKWLKSNHDSERELRVGLHRKDSVLTGTLIDVSSKSRRTLPVTGKSRE